MEIANGQVSTTGAVWEILSASYEGDLQKVQALTQDEPALLYTQYNYTPPVHFAVREGHLELVEYLLGQGACDLAYRTYPFLDDLHTMAKDRGFTKIASLLKDYSADRGLQKFSGDNGKIDYGRDAQQRLFEHAVDRNDAATVKNILEKKPEYATDETYFWGEGILMMPAKEGHSDMIDLLMAYGAKVPGVLKWAQEYYFKRAEIGALLLQRGMDPNTRSWQQVTLLHDMAQKGNIEKASLLIKYGAAINLVEDEYQSTPLGLAARWGQLEMVKYLIGQGADVNKAGATWATPLAWAGKRNHDSIEQLLLANGAVL